MSPSICGVHPCGGSAPRRAMPNGATTPIGRLRAVGRTISHALAHGTLLCLVALACTLLAACPHSAWAEPDSIVIDALVPNPYSYGGTGSFVRTDDASSPVAYSAQGWLVAPREGQRLERHEPLDIPELDYVVYHGYDGKTVTSIYGLDEEQSEAATGVAVWLAISCQDADVLSYSSSDNETIHGNQMYFERWQRLEDERVKAAAKALYEEGLDYRDRGAGGDEAGCAVLWLNRTPNESDGTPSYQALVTSEKTTDVTFQKTSAAPEITDLSPVYSLEGSVYDIYIAESEERVGTITTDENGRATLALEPNTSYYAVETSASAGYELSGERIPFTVGSGSTTVEVEGTPRTFAFEITKRDAATGGAAQPGASLEGAEYTLSSTTTHRFSTSGATDEAGKLTLERIPLGGIRIVETRASLGYTLDTVAKTYEVMPDDIADEEPYVLSPTDDFPEVPIACDIEITKTLDIGQPDDPEHAGAPAEGITFQIISNTTGEVVGSLTTDGEGVATSEGMWMGTGTRPDGAKGALPFDIAGYTVHEDPATTPEGFTALEDWTIRPEDLVDGATLRYAVTNTMVTSLVTIVKTDAETGSPIMRAGFSFTLLDEQGRPLDESAWYPAAPATDTFTTDETGQVALPAYLREGTYLIRETQAAAPYVLPNEDTRLEIGDGKGTPQAVASVADTAASGCATLTNTCSIDQQPLEGAEYDVVAQSDIIAWDGAVIAPAGAIVDHVTTDADGTARTGTLPLGRDDANYAFVQTGAAPGHAVDTEPIAFTVTYQDQQTAVVETHIDVVSEPTAISITKVDARDETRTLPGASFDIVPVSAAEPQPDDDGPDIGIPDEGDNDRPDDQDRPAPGTDDDEGQREDENPSEATRTASTWTTEGDGTDNEPELDAPADQASEPTNDEGEESSGDKTEDRPDGADDDADAKPEPSHITDANGMCTAIHLEQGTYRIEETEAPAGFIAESDGIAFTVDARGLIDGQAYASFTIANDVTKLDVSKRSKADESFIEGAELSILDAAGQTVEHWTSEAGPHRIEGIAPGQYTLVETTEDGAAQEKTGVEFTVEAIAEVQTVTMYDEEIGISGQIDKRQERVEKTGAGRSVAYSVDFCNTSNTWVDEFTVTDEIEAAQAGTAKVESIELPSASGDVDDLFNVWYRTEGGPDSPETTDANATLDDGHLNPLLDEQEVRASVGDDARSLDYHGWKLHAKGVSTELPIVIQAEDFSLKEGERIVAIRLEFGAVEAGFSSRDGSWDRADLKDPDDTIDSLEPKEQHPGTPLIVRMTTTDTFTEGAELANKASLDLYRNGGGEKLEAHDTDRVSQTAGSAIGDLDQTGLSIGGFLLVAAVTAGVSAVSIVHDNRRRTLRAPRGRW